MLSPREPEQPLHCYDAADPTFRNLCLSAAPFTQVLLLTDQKRACYIARLRNIVIKLIYYSQNGI